ncbi:hypothetical protein [Enterobacter kobei]|uniref:hypothetical protein n=1 Tax=Enterobacter kobei TaxID=208224 RepID=UPI0037CF90CE
MGSWSWSVSGGEHGWWPAHSGSGRRTLAAKALATTGKIEMVQLLLSHAEPDHVWRYLDVDKQTIRHAFELAL